MISISEEKIIDFQSYKDKKEKEEIDEFQEIKIDSLLDEINEDLENLRHKSENKEEYIVKLFNIRDYIINN